MRLEERRSAWLHFHAALTDGAATGNAGPAFGDQPSRARRCLRQSNAENNMSAPVFPRRVLKAAGGLEHLSAQWSGEGGEGRS